MQPITQQHSNTLAIAGIHTGIGKTVVSAVLTEALGADYWKPVQAGLEEQDSLTVGSLITNSKTRIHAEALKLQAPMSPHAAAAAEGITIKWKEFAWPKTDNLLLVETAGGILSPMSDTDTMADFISWNGLPTLLVTRHYLGSINHTLCALEVLKHRGINVPAIIVSGGEDQPSETFIRDYGYSAPMIHVPQFEQLDKATVASVAAKLREQLAGILR